jgi:hypothetical protein
MDIYQSSSSNPFQTGNGEASLEHVQLQDPGFDLKVWKHVLVTACDNQDDLFIGPVGTPDGSGYALPPNESVKVPIDAVSKITIWSETQASGELYKWLAV